MWRLTISAPRTPTAKCNDNVHAPGNRCALDKSSESGRLAERWEKLKARMRAKMEHPFRVIKVQFDYAKARYRGIKKNAARLTMLLAFANLLRVKKQLLAQAA